MERIIAEPRDNWQGIVEAQGFDWHTTADGDPYWDESVAYGFTPTDIDRIKGATNELWDLCLKGVEHILDKDLTYKLGLPSISKKMILDSWEQEHPSIYGRFDLAYDGINEPKMLEFNAQTPTSLLEAAAIQWAWSGDVFPLSSQFNDIEANLLSKWADLAGSFMNTLYFTSANNSEDYGTCNYLGTLASQQGIPIDYIAIGDIGWDRTFFRDLREIPMRNVFTLYPFEWLLKEQGAYMQQCWHRMRWMEPAWKLILANKAFLAILWELFPGHPNLLESYLHTPGKMANYVSKPFYSREGSNVSIFEDSKLVVETTGAYAGGGTVFQERASVYSEDDRYAVIGSWHVTDYGASGIGVRESDGPITNNLSRFVPHIIL